MMMKRLGKVLLATCAALSLAMTACEQTSPLAPKLAPAEGVLAIHVNAAGTITLNGESVTMEELELRLKAAAASNPQPLVHIEPDRDASFRVVGGVMALAQRTGLMKFGVIGGT